MAELNALYRCIAFAPPDWGVDPLNYCSRQPRQVAERFLQKRVSRREVQELANVQSQVAGSVHFLWIADEAACRNCQALARGSPYTEKTIPTWPRDKGTCLDKCRCYIGIEKRLLR